MFAFEQAEHETDPKLRDQELTFVVVGGGPTGVEIAGAMGELVHFTLGTDFRSIQPNSVRILLIEAGPRILAVFSQDLACQAQKQLERLGVEVRVGTPVEIIDANGVVVLGERIFSLF